LGNGQLRSLLPSLPVRRLGRQDRCRCAQPCHVRNGWRSMSVSLRHIGPVMLVGAGQMGLALARGWLDAGLPATHLLLVDPAPSPAAEQLAADYGLVLNADASGLLPNVLVLAVKPQIIDAVMTPLRSIVGPHTLAISVAAGIDIARLSRGLEMGRVV